MRNVKKLEFGQEDRNAALKKKRKEILTKMEATIRMRKESELRRRAERMNHMNHSIESMDDDSDESDSEKLCNVEQRVDKGGYSLLTSREDESVAMSPLSSTTNRRTARTSMIGTARTRQDDSSIKTSLPLVGRRATIGKENTDDSWGTKGKQKRR